MNRARSKEFAQVQMLRLLEIRRKTTTTKNNIRNKDFLIYFLPLVGGHDRRDMFPSAEAINGNGNTPTAMETTQVFFQQQQQQPFISTARWTQRKGQPTE